MAQETRTFRTTNGETLSIRYEFDHAAVPPAGTGEIAIGITRETDHTRSERVDGLSGSNIYLGATSIDETVVPNPAQGRWTSVSDVARTILQEAGQPTTNAAIDQLSDFIIAQNDLRDAQGVECDGDRRDFAIIWPGQVLQIPDMLDQHGQVNVQTHLTEQCPPLQFIPEQEVVEITSQGNLAQYVPVSAGAYDFSLGVISSDYFTGRSPRDPAVRGHSRNDRVVDGALRPGDSEGTRVRDANGTIVTSRAGNARGQHGELEYGPSQVVFYDPATGAMTPNTYFNQKFEQAPRFEMDESGSLYTVIDGSALISFDRRLNPYHGNIWRDAMSARNLINQWNNTGEGRMAITTFAGIMRADQAIDDRLADYPTPEDALRGLELNTQLALHPIMWSVSSEGVPVGNPAAIRERMENLIASGYVSPEKETEFRGYMDLLHDPVALNAAIEASGGRANWYNPMSDWAHERAGLDFIRDGYGDRPGVDRPQLERETGPGGGHLNTSNAAVRNRDLRQQIEADRAERAAEVGQEYATLMWNKVVTPPTQTEIALGEGRLFDTAAQTPAAMVASRQELLSRIYNDDTFRAQYIDHLLATPGAFEAAVVTPLHLTAKDGVVFNRTGNNRILGFEGHRAAQGFVEQSSAELGGEEWREKVRWDGNVLTNVVTSPITLLTLGAKQVGLNRNQNRGLSGFEDDVRERWNDAATRGQVDAAIRDIAARAYTAQENGVDLASTGFAYALNPALVENANGGQQTDAYRALRTAGGETIAKLADDQLAVNINFNGLAARVEQSLETKVANGEIAADNTGAWDVSAAVAAAGNPTELARVIATANNPGLVSQADTDSALVVRSADNAPVWFSLMAVQQLAYGNQSAMSQKVGMIDRGKEEHSAYADMLDRYAREMRDPNAQPGQIMARALNDFSAFFAAGGDPSLIDQRQQAASQLAGYASEDANISRMFGEMYRGELDSGAILGGLVAGGSLTEQDRMALLAMQANSDPAARAAAFDNWLNRDTEINHTLTAGVGISYVEVMKLALLLYRPPGDDLPPTVDEPCPPPPPPPCIEPPVWELN